VIDIKRTLPDYDDPPVTETVVGVRFSPLTPFTTRLFNLYGKSISDEYPNVEIREPIARTSEEFGKRPRVSPVEILKGANFRCWYIDKTETRLIQFQRDGFFHNWRKIQEDDLYLHYDNTKPTFEKHWLAFCEFLKTQKLMHPAVDQCEVTYINHIEIGRGWESFGELNRVVSCWSGQYSGSFLPDPESVAISVQYVLPENGRLHVNVQPAIRKKDAKEILQLSLTARGKPKTSDVKDLGAWMDLGHEWIVNGFTDFTTKAMHEQWRRKL
jgi:uncharacterized protein (TIGR04255 family)